MVGSLAYAFSRVEAAYLLIAQMLRWIGVILSGSDTSTNTMFGYFKYKAGLLLGFPPLLLLSLNTIGSENRQAHRSTGYQRWCFNNEICV